MYKLIINDTKEIGDIENFQESLSIENGDIKASSKLLRFYIQYDPSFSIDYLREFSYCIGKDNFDLKVLNDNGMLVWQSSNYSKFNNINLIRNDINNGDVFIYIADFRGKLE